MQDDVEVSKLVKLVKCLVKTNKGLLFSRFIRAKYIEFNMAVALANRYYMLLKRAEGYRKVEDQLLNAGDQSQFTYILIAKTLSMQGVSMNDVEECKRALMSLLSYDVYDKSVQSRMAKCLLEAKKQINTHS